MRNPICPAKSEISCTCGRCLVCGCRTHGRALFFRRRRQMHFAIAELQESSFQRFLHLRTSTRVTPQRRNTWYLFRCTEIVEAAVDAVRNIVAVFFIIHSVRHGLMFYFRIIDTTIWSACGLIGGGIFADEIDGRQHFATDRLIVITSGCSIQWICIRSASALLAESHSAAGALEPRLSIELCRCRIACHKIFKYLFRWYGILKREIATCFANKRSLRSVFAQHKLIGSR